MKFLKHIKLNLDYSKLEKIYKVKEIDPFVFFINNKDKERQGWKIHISATITNYQKILLLVVSKLCQHWVSFKFLKDKNAFYYNISKRSDINNKGKFITIYPVNTKQFLNLLESLYLLLKNFQGVEIDTDRRYKDSQNVFYRYGVKHAKKMPDYLFYKGKKYLDERSLTRYHPKFIKDPVINNINPKITGKFLDYKIEYCLNKHVGGFVFYALENITNKPFILINVRKNILNSKKETLIRRRLSEIKIFYEKYLNLKIPKIFDHFYDSEKNLWLVKEYIEGTNFDLLKNECAIQFNSSFSNVDFFQIYLTVFSQLIEITHSFHEQNLILNDIKPSNFLIKKSLEIYFIDPEHSYQLSQYKDFYHQINTPYLSKLLVKNRHKSLDYHKLGMVTIDLICGTDLFIKLDDNLSKLLNYLDDIFKYYNFDPELLNLIQNLVLQPDQVDLLKCQNILKNIQNKYQFNLGWAPQFDELILSKIQKQIITLHKKLNRNINWKLNNNTKLEKFADFVIYFDKYSDLSKDEKLLLKQKLSDISKKNFYSEMLLIILNSFENAPNSNIKKQFISKVQDFIKNNLFQMHSTYLVKKEVYIPYIEDGTAGLCLILIYGKYFLQVDDFDQLIDDILSTIKNPFIQKVKFHFGLTGYVFLFLKAYQLWKPNQQYLKDALECCYFLVHQMIDHKTIYDYDYTKLSLKEIKLIKYVTAQLFQYYR